MCLKRPEVEKSFFLYQFLLYVLRQGLSLNLELADLASLASELALGIPCLSPPHIYHSCLHLKFFNH